jgi:hypothetical protein
MEAAFEPLSDHLAQLSIVQPGGGGSARFGVRTSGWPPVHEVGVSGAPRWRLSPAASPDDGWSLETLGSGTLLARDAPVPESLEWRYLTWAEGTRAEAGAALLGALPPGRYLLARATVEPRREAAILLGNEWVPSPENARVLLDRRPHYAALLGPSASAPPPTDQPLLGLVVLNYVGDSVVDAGLFFAGAEPRPGPAPAGDLVLVVPVEGELLIDALAGFSSESEERARARWKAQGARGLAVALTGIPGLR